MAAIVGHYNKVDILIIVGKHFKNKIVLQTKTKRNFFFRFCRFLPWEFLPGLNQFQVMQLRFMNKI